MNRRITACEAPSPVDNATQIGTVWNVHRPFPSSHWEGSTETLKESSRGTENGRQQKKQDQHLCFHSSHSDLHWLWLIGIGFICCCCWTGPKKAFKSELEETNKLLAPTCVCSHTLVIMWLLKTIAISTQTRPCNDPQTRGCSLNTPPFWRQARENEAEAKASLGSWRHLQRWGTRVCF